MRLRTIAVVGILAALAAAATVAPASGRSAAPGPCHGRAGLDRIQCLRWAFAADRCARGRERSINVCSEAIVRRLAADDLEGRDNGTPGSALARGFLIDQVKRFSRGLNRTAHGDDAYVQPIPGGDNVVSVIPGTDLASQYVVLGAHYDHLGHFCISQQPDDTICNGATDNAAGVAAVVTIGRAIAKARPRRSVVLALWDEEEDGLFGSFVYTQQPLVPLASTVANVNFDIQGANLLPSLRNTTFAVGAETGGSRLQEIVRRASRHGPLDTAQLSWIFGEGRSDYLSFLDVGVPAVFFTDATGPCYHTAQDEVDVVDFRKLTREIRTALGVTGELANTSTPPAFDPAKFRPTSLDATYDDLVNFGRVLERGSADIGRFSAADQATIQSVRTTVRRLLAEGRAEFGSRDVVSLLFGAAQVVDLLTHGECDGFLAHGPSHGS